MKQKILIKRITAIILTLAILMTGIPVTTASAETGNIADDVLSVLTAEVERTLEEIEEVERDKVSHVRAGNWYIAINIDKLPYNFFHKAVQADIVAKNSGVEAEKIMRYKDENGELTGKYGYADLYMDAGGKSYIWEVKPFSYKKDPNKKLGEDQLAGYVGTDPTYQTGDSRIEDGVIVIPIGVIHAG